MMLVGSLIFELDFWVTKDFSLKGLNSGVMNGFFLDLNNNFKWDKENNLKKEKIGSKST